MADRIIEPAHNYPTGSDEWAACHLLAAALALAVARLRDPDSANATSFAFDATVGAARLEVTHSAGLYRATLHVHGQASATTWDSASVDALLGLAETLDLLLTVGVPGA